MKDYRFVFSLERELTAKELNELEIALSDALQQEVPMGYFPKDQDTVSLYQVKKTPLIKCNHDFEDGPFCLKCGCTERLAKATVTEQD